MPPLQDAFATPDLPRTQAQKLFSRPGSASVIRVAFESPPAPKSRMQPSIAF
jgi:hypothetical protein